MRRAKIVATLGPSSSDPDTIRELLELGVDVARLNFSHGRHEDHAAVLDALRAASRKLAKEVAVLQDLQGPKIRTGPLRAGRVGVELHPGEPICITTEREVLGEAALVSTTYPYLASDVRRGDRVLIDDGLIELEVVDTDGVRALCEVVEGGVLKPNKGINLPGVALRAEALSDKDRVDLAFGLAHGVDCVGLSFVRTAEDIERCRAEVARSGRSVPIIAKIEKPEAIDDLDAIVAAADGLMVARGDLGVEIEPERVPALQKEIVRKGNAAGKPVIIATQMLESMIEHPRPTRAEASDVANAVWDGADALMLSGESASGKYPKLAVEMMDRIIREAEATTGADALRGRTLATARATSPDVSAAAACSAAADWGAAAICCFTLSGTTARLVSHFRPAVPVVAFSPDQSISRRMALYWGVVPRIMEPAHDPDLMADMVSQRLVAEGFARPGDRIVLVYGSPLGIAGKTNSLRLHEIPPEPGREDDRS
jgi:pyruvate kinase